MQHTAKAWPAGGGFPGNVAIYDGEHQIGTWCGWSGDETELPRWFAKFKLQIVGPVRKETDDYGYGYTLYQLAKIVRR